MSLVPDQVNVEQEEMNIRMVPLHDLRSYENNPKQHPVRQLESIVQSIQRFGFQQPLVIDKNNTIVCGHARYEAAATLGLGDVPCQIADNLTEQQINAYRILDNEIAAQGYTDQLALNIEMAKLPDFDFKPFNLELPKLNILNEGLCGEDEVPAAAAETITKRGDVWILGNHRLMCGDSTMIDDVDKLIDGEKADMVFTDPPYGIGYSSNKYGNSITKKHDKRNVAPMIAGDEKIFDPSLVIEIFKECKEIFIWGFQYYPVSLGRGGVIVWNKKMESEREAAHGDFELCWSKQERNKMFWHRWGGFNNKEKGEDRLHTTQKPIVLAEWFFDHWGKSSNLIVDLFGGSGSTLIACEKTNRKCFMLEISEHYCDIIVRRWEKFSGRKACLESTGTMFGEVANV